MVTVVHLNKLDIPSLFTNIQVSYVNPLKKARAHPPAHTGGGANPRTRTAILSMREGLNGAGPVRKR
jgi:hypothetical protein